MGSFYGFPAALAALLLLQPASQAEQVLRVEQLTGGLPGLKAGERIRQVLWIGEQRLRLDEIPQGGGAPVPRYLLNAEQDPPVIYELFPRKKSYRTWKELQNLQADRDTYELQLLAATASLPAEERDRVRATYHVREGLKREVKLEESGGRSVTLEGKTYKCRRLIVTENERVILDALITDEIAQGRSYYRFYRRLGVFSDQVLGALKDVKGFPLKAKICVVTGKLKGYYELTIEVVSVRSEEVPSSFFDIPKDWTEETKPLRVTCANRTCSNIVEPANPAGGKFRWRGRWYYFCSRECRRAFIDELKRALMQAGGEPRGPGKRKSSLKKTP